MFPRLIQTLHVDGKIQAIPAACTGTQQWSRQLRPGQQLQMRQQRPADLISIPSTAVEHFRLPPNPRRRLRQRAGNIIARLIRPLGAQEICVPQGW